MVSSRGVRSVVILALLVVLFGLLVWHGTLEPNPAMGSYPGAVEVSTEYDRYVGHRVAIGGRVVGTDPVTIRAEYGVDSEIRLRVDAIDASTRLATGDRLHVYGVLEPGRTIRALEVVVVPRIRAGYMYGISFLAGFWVFARLVRHWRFDIETWSVQRRASPLKPRTNIRPRREGGDGGDA